MYILRLNTPIEPVELLQEAYRTIGMEGIEAEINVFKIPRANSIEREWNGPRCNGMGISATDQNVARLNNQEDFDVDLNQCLYFFIDKFEDRLVQDIQAVKVVLRMLELYEGDVLFENTRRLVDT
jgi:hypothetical protein